MWVMGGFVAMTAAADDGRLGVQAYSFRHLTVVEAIEKTRAVGGQVIELFLWQKLAPDQPNVVFNERASPEHIARVQEQLRACGVRAVSAYFNNSAFADRTNLETNVRRLFEFARTMGLKALTGEPPTEHLDLVERMVREYGIELHFHNHPKNPSRPEYRNWDPEYLMSLMKDRDARMGFSVDIGHLTRSGLRAADVIRRMGPRVRSVHLKDVVDASPGSKDVPLGHGVTDIGAVLQALREIGFQGHMVIEYEAQTPNLEQEVRESLAFVCERWGSK
jgi:sugar phosphate isomerase/epimerase